MKKQPMLYFEGRFSMGRDSNELEWIEVTVIYCIFNLKRLSPYPLDIYLKDIYELFYTCKHGY